MNNRPPLCFLASFIVPDMPSVCVPSKLIIQKVPLSFMINFEQLTQNEYQPALYEIFRLLNIRMAFAYRFAVFKQTKRAGLTQGFTISSVY